jgi:acetyl esterase/lipase
MITKTPLEKTEVVGRIPADSVLPIPSLARNLRRLSWFKPGLAPVRLLLSALSAAAASLIVFGAPTYHLWILRIGVTEWGHVLALLALTPLLPGWRRSRLGRISAALGLCAALLSLTPLLQAALLARELPTQLAISFGVVSPRTAPGAAARQAPLLALDLLGGVASPPVHERSLVYVTRDGQPLQLDLYQPLAAQAAMPVVVIIHGGSWRSGNSTQLSAFNHYLAARGYAVAAINYRLAPEHPFPAARDDVLAALAYLKSNAADLGLDPQRIVLLGRSAGGQLALLVAYTAGDPSIRGAVSFYAPADMRYGYANPANPAVIDSRAILSDYLGGSPEQVPAVYDAASPINFVDPTTPPTLLIHGGSDDLVLLGQSERLDARLAAAGRPHLLLQLPWATHGADANFSGPSGQLSTYAVERFLAAVMH